MKLSYWMMAKAVVCIIFGVGFVLAPAPVFGLYGITLNAGSTMIAQLFGCSFIVLATLLWFAHNAAGSELSLRAIVLGVFVGDVIGFIIALLAQLNGVTNALGWMIVALYLILAAGFGYFQFSPVARSTTAGKMAR